MKLLLSAGLDNITCFSVPTKRLGVGSVKQMAPPGCSVACVRGCASEGISAVHLLQQWHETAQDRSLSGFSLRIQRCFS